MWASCSAHALSTRGAMLSGPLALLGFTCWNARRTSSSLVWSLWKSSSAADAPFKASLICLGFQFIGFIGSVRWENFLLPFTYRLINFMPLHTLLILLLVKRLSTFCLHCSFSFRISSFSSFCTDLYSSLSFFWNASFFRFMILLIILVIQGLLFGNIFTVFCGIARSTEKSTYPHSDLVHWYHLLSQQIHPNQCSLEIP